MTANVNAAEGIVVWRRRKNTLPARVISLVVMLAVLLVIGGLPGLGCMTGIQAIGWSGGTVSDGKLFVGSREGRLVAIDITSGSRMWTEPLKATSQNGGLSCFGSMYGGGGCLGGSAGGVPIYGTPVVSGELVYIGGYNGRIYAYHTNSLQMSWVYPVDGYLQPVVGGLAVARDKVFFGCSDGKVYALEAGTNNKVWEFETADQVWSTPVIEGNSLYVTSFDGTLYVLDADTGKKLWDYQTEGAIAATPLIHNNTVYVGSFSRYLYAVDIDSHSLKWRFMGKNWFWARPVAHGGLIYAPCLDGKVYVIDEATGQQVAVHDLGSPVSSSPVLVGDLLILATRDGSVYSLDTSAEAEPKIMTNVGGSVFGPLAADSGIVYIHTQNLNIHRVDVSTGAELPTISLEREE